jgi:predicted ATPase/DNA-binding SARP family transcriptional activator
MLEVRLLGTFEVKHKKKPINISSRPAQSLFAYLILNARSSHRREKLAGMLWPDSLEETARDNLRHALWRLRKVFPSKPATEYLLPDDLSIAFNASADYWLDAAELEKLSENASVDELITSLSEYQGELLPGFYDEWVVLEREHLYSIFEHHMARLMSLLQNEHRWLDVLDWAKRWLKLGQKPEPAYRALMSAHAAQGDMSKVAATYERCIRSLKEFGIEPSDQTRALYERLKAGKETFEADSTVSLKEKRKGVPKTNLPVPLTSFIGREKEVEEIIKLLGKNRLVTLIGSGGVGKTRLAIQSANRLINKFKDGVWWVDLVGLTDPSRVPQAVAQVVDVPGIPNQPLIKTLAEYIRTKQTLLILDNCEHLISACAQLADQLLSACEKLKILATSREGLDLLGERIWPVPSLSLPEMQATYAIKSLNKFESIRLFSERALLVQPKFEITDQNAQAVAQTCRRLSGMPLAIELAAARVKMMSVDEIAKRLDDRFDLLTAGNRTALPRHQTLRATIDWSFDLLSQTERILFRRLSVFVGGFTLKAAEGISAGEDIVASQVIELLGNLINKSLVRVEERSGDVQLETRYGMLETIREYAREKLREAGEEVMLRNRHLEFFLNIVEEVGPKLEGSEQKLLLDRLEIEIDNLRAAMDWALEGQQTNTALRFAGAFPRFWFIRAHHNEGVERLKTILDRPDAQQPTPARLRALNAYLFMLWPAGQLSEMQPHGEEALALGIRLGDRWNSGFALLWLGVAATAQGDYSLSQSYLEQSLEIWQELEEGTYAAWSYVFRGEVALLQGDTTSAQELYLQAVPLLRQAQDSPFLAIPLRRLGQLAMLQGDYFKAAQFIKESLQNNWTVHDYRGIGACLATFATLSLAQRETERAIKLLAVADAILEFIRTPFLAFDQQQYENNISQLRGQIDKPTFMKAWAEGHTMTFEQAVDFALKNSSREKSVR